MVSLTDAEIRELGDFIDPEVLTFVTAETTPIETTFDPSVTGPVHGDRPTYLGTVGEAQLVAMNEFDC